MTFLAILTQALAFYCVYNTSQRVELRKDKWNIWLQRHVRFSAGTGIILFTISITMMIGSLGFATGIFTAFLSVMTIGSVIILFVPMTVRKN